MPYLDHSEEGPSYPFIGHAINFLNNIPWDLMSGWNKRYGNAVSFHLLGTLHVTLGSPNLLRQVLQSKISSVKKDVEGSYSNFLVILGTGIVTSEGPSWMKQRLKLSRPLRHDILHVIPQQTLIAIQKWMVEELDPACKSGEAVPIGEGLRHLTLRVISGSFLSLTAEESDENLAKWYLPIMDEANQRLWRPDRAYNIFLPSYWKFLYDVYCLNKYMNTIIRNRWELRKVEKVSSTKQRQEDILDKILEVYETEFPKAISLPNWVARQFRDELKTFMLAGHETSAAMMTWALYELLGDKTLMQQAIIEGSHVFGIAGGKDVPDWARATADQLPSRDELAKLQFCEATLKESLRKYPPVPVTLRRTAKDLCLEEEDGCGITNKYLIPKGSALVVNIQAVHRDPKLWPDPYRFDPMRFLRPLPSSTTTAREEEIENRCKEYRAGSYESATPEQYTFLPFISGPRNCLGQHMALLESKMVLALLVQRYRFSLSKESAPIYVGREWSKSEDPRHSYMVPLIPKEELYVQVSKK